MIITSNPTSCSRAGHAPAPPYAVAPALLPMDIHNEAAPIVRAAPSLVQPPWPPPSNRMPCSAAGLVAGIAGLFDVEHGAHAATRVRGLLPDILAHFFPWAAYRGADIKGISFYLADCVLLYVLQKSKAHLPQPHLRAFVDDFCAALSVARKITRLIELGEDIDPIIEHGVRRFLQQGRTVLCPAGVNQGHNGHAMMLLMMPQPDGHVLCAVFNRGEGLEPWHDRDGEKVRPWLATLPGETLCGAAGAAALRPLLALQVPHENNTVAAYYHALNTLVDACGGTRLLSGLPAADALIVPGQSLQKSNECTVSSTFAAMNFMMHVQLRCWQEPPTCSHNEALAVYRKIKQACRKAILDEVVAERDVAVRQRNLPQGQALTGALCDTATAILQRLPRKPALRACYEALPPDVRLLAETTSSSAA